MDLKLIEQKANLACAFYSAGHFCTAWPDTAQKVANMALERGVPFATNLSSVSLMADPIAAVRMLHLLPLTDFLFGTVEQAVAFGSTTGTGIKKQVSDGKTKSTNFEDDMLQKAEKVAQEISREQFQKQRSGTCVVVLTNGEEPTMVTCEKGVTYYPVHPIEDGEVVDKIGAGDAFVGGFLAQLVRDKESKLETMVRIFTLPSWCLLFLSHSTAILTDVALLTGLMFLSCCSTHSSLGHSLGHSPAYLLQCCLLTDSLWCSQIDQGHAAAKLCIKTVGCGTPKSEEVITKQLAYLNATELTALNVAQSAKADTSRYAVLADVHVLCVGDALPSAMVPVCSLICCVCDPVTEAHRNYY